MKKKIVSLALVLALCLSLLPVTAFAEEGESEVSTTTVDTWDGTADTNWYTGHETDTEYRITTAEQLAGLAQLVNADPGTTNFSGKTFYLENDLNLSGHEWISIGTVLGGDYPEYSFCGVFDGKGHVISNLYSHESYIEGADESHNLLRNALFGSVHNGEVKNLGVADAEIWIDSKDDSAAGKGILVDWMGKSKITNCWTSGSIYSGTKTEKNIGGIVGITMQGCTISGCYSTATLTGNFTNSEGYYKDPNQAKWPCDTIGGIVGARFDGGLTVTDCWFDGKIVVNSIKATVGGIVGCIATVNNSVGGIVGCADVATVNNCMVTTTDMGVDNDGNTCWVAYAPGGTVTNNYWPNNDKYGAIPREDVAGTPVSDFTSGTILTSLNENAGDGITWVAGINHPTFAWDKWHISADYAAVDEALKNVPEDLSRYTDASVATLNEAIAAVGARDKNVTQKEEVNAMAQAIQKAIDGLVRKSSSSSRPRYDVTTPSKPENGSVTVDPERARSGSRVTVTVTPDSGYKLGELVVTDKDGKKLELTDKGNGQYTFTMPSGKVEVAAEFVKEVEVSPFADVATDAYYYDAVKWAVNKGITNGVSETLFGPDQACTRAQIVTFLYRALGKLAAAQAGFTDVAADSYYADAVNWAAENGVTKGISETLFGPDGSCTRAQIVTFLYRAYQGK